MWIPAICPVCHLRYLKRAPTDIICPNCKAKLISRPKAAEKPIATKSADSIKVPPEPVAAKPAASLPAKAIPVTKSPKSDRTQEPAKIIKICQRCKKIFLTNQPAAKYCSRACKENAKKTRSRHGLTAVETKAEPKKEIWPDRSKGPVTDSAVTIPCAYCGTPFVPKSIKSKYCSNRCAERAKNMRKVRVCPSCGIEFRTSSDNTKYCDTCAKKFWVRKRR